MGKDIDKMLKSELKEELANKNKEVEELKDQFDSMKKMMEDFMKSQGQAPARAVPSAPQRVNVICYLYEHNIFEDKDGNRMEFMQSGDMDTISVNELSALMKKNKMFFQKGLLAFEDEQWYDYFHISKKYLLTDDFLKDVLSKEELKDVISELNKITDNKRDKIVFRTLMYRVAALAKDGFNIMKIMGDLRDYFGQDLIALSQKI